MLQEALDPLSIDSKRVYSIVFSTGGPHVELEMTCDDTNNVLSGEAVGYWGGTTVRRYLSNQALEAIQEHYLQYV